MIHDNQNFFNEAANDDHNSARPMHVPASISNPNVANACFDAPQERRAASAGAASISTKESPMLAQILSYLLFETPLSGLLPALEARGFWLVYKAGRLSIERMPAEL